MANFLNPLRPNPERSYLAISVCTIERTTTLNAYTTINYIFLSLTGLLDIQGKP